MEGAIVSAADTAYGEAGVAVVTEQPRSASRDFLPLLALVIGLAAATIGYVVVPTLTKPPAKQRSCEVYVLESGLTKCVPIPTRESLATHHKSSGRAEH